MDNPAYNSLAEKLKQTGILADPNFDTTSSPQIENVFLKGLKESTQEEEKKEEVIEEKAPEPQAKKPAKKRINRYDLDIAKEETKTKAKPLSPLMVLKKLIALRRSAMAETPSISLKERFFNGFFPKLYKIKIAKDAVQKLNELDIDTEALLEKSVPYGESESRYDNLVKYLNYANQIQTKLNKKFY